MNTKKIQKKAIFASVCIILLMISGITTGFVPAERKIEKKYIDLKIVSDIQRNQLDQELYPDLSKNQEQSYGANTGYEPWYYYIGGIINSANGNLYLSTKDISIKGRGFNLELNRIYNSHSSNYSTGFGFGWTFNYNTYLIDCTSYVLWIDGDGSLHNFTALSGGQYSSPAGIYSRLTKNGEATYTLWMKNGEKYLFSSKGILEKIVDKNNNKLTFIYSESRLTRIEDDSGEYLTITYNERNKITTISDPLGRQIIYSYDIYDNLIRVTDATGNATQYQYMNCHKIANIIDRTNTTLSFDYYHDLPWVRDVRNSVYNEETQELSNPFMVLFIVYDLVNSTVYYLNAENYASSIQMNAQGNPILFIDPLSNIRLLSWIDNTLISYTDANKNTYSYDYDSYGNLIEIIDPFGYKTIDQWTVVDTTTQYLSMFRNATQYQYEPGTKTILFNDSLEPSQQPGWIPQLPWALTNQFSFSPPNSWGCGGFGGYGLGLDARLDTPVFNLSGYTDVELTFLHQGDFEGTPGQMHDGGNVKISTDGGLTWNLITPDGGYDGKLTFARGNPMEVQRAFGYTYPWKPERFDLTSYVGMTTSLIIRFEMGTDNFPSPNMGWFIDNIKITGYTAVLRNITTRFSYDTQGNLLTIQDGLGNTSYYTYLPSDHGQVSDYTDFRAYTTSYQYDTHGYLRNTTDATGNITRLTYDSIGRIINYTDANGHSTKTFYDKNDRIIKTIDATGNSTLYQYNANGAMIRQINARNQQTTYTNNVVGRVEKIQDPTGNVTYYRYTRNGMNTGTTDASGNTSKINYDPLDRPISVTDALGNTEWYGYDNAGNVVWVMNKNNIMTYYEYDKFNRLTRIIDPYFNEVVYTYDERGNRIRFTDQNGFDTNYTYDDLNRLTRVTGLDSCGCDERRYIYDENGNINHYIDANNQVTTYVYDPLNRVKHIFDPTGNFSEYSYDAVGNVLSFIDRNNHKTTYEYDPMNRLKKITDPLGNNTFQFYDEIGNLKSVQNARGFTTTFEYDVLNRLINSTDPSGNFTRYIHDARGNVIQVTQANNETIHYEYDALDRITQIMDQRGFNTTYTYDVLGNIEQVVDANGSSIRFWYDMMNRVVSSGNPLVGDYYYYTYDKKGNLATVQDPNNGFTYYYYDELSRPHTVQSPLGYTTQYTYDGVGNIICRTDANWNQTNYTFNPLNQITRIDYPTGNITFGYDAEGNLLHTEQKGLGLDCSLTYQYNAVNLPTTILTDYGSFNKTISYSYDEVGNVKTLTTPESGTIQYTYDTLSRLKTITTPTLEQYIFTYDSIGRKIKQDYPTGVSTGFDYDPANRLMNITTKKSDDTILSRYRYTYDNVGNKLSMRNRTDALTQYSYDFNYRLKGVIRPDGTTVDYTYDNIGNRLTKTINLSQTTWYTPDSENRLISDGTTTYTYDNNGNLRSKTGSSTNAIYTYDYENRLTSATLPDGTVISYQYSPLLERFSKFNGATTSYYLYDKEDIIAEYDSAGNLISSYIHGSDIDEPLMMEQNGVKSYYHYDGIGSVTQTTDQTETTQNAYTYDEFGVQQTIQESIPNMFTYTSREKEPEIGLYYYRLRYYDPTIGRFTSKDPIKSFGNQYIYTDNNPINYNDPYGLKGGSILQQSKHSEKDSKDWWTKYLYGKHIATSGVINMIVEEISDVYEGDPITWKERQDGSGGKCYERTITRTPYYVDHTLKEVQIKWWYTEEGLKEAQRLSVEGNFKQYVGGILTQDALQDIKDLIETIKDPTGLGQYYELGTDMYEGAEEGLETYRGLRAAGQGTARAATTGIAAAAGPAVVAWAYEKLLEEIGDSLKTKGAEQLRLALIAMRNAYRTETTEWVIGVASEMVNFKDASGPWCQVPCSKPTTTTTTTSTPTSSTPSSPPVPTPAPVATPITPSTSGGSSSQPSATPQGPPQPVPTGGGIGSSQGGVSNPPYVPLEPETTPALPGIGTNPPGGGWEPKLPVYNITTPPINNTDNGTGFGPGTGGDFDFPPSSKYCNYRIVYFGSDAIQDNNENHKALYNAIKWAARKRPGIPTTILIMPSAGGYSTWTSWQQFAGKYPDIILSRWSDTSNDRTSVTYAGLKIRNPDVLIDSNHFSPTEQGGFYTENEVQAIQKYLLDEHGYIATQGTLGDHPQQTNQTDNLLNVLGLKKTNGEPHTFYNSNPWIFDAAGHPILFDISSGWNPGAVTGNVDIGVCPLCGEEHLGSKLAHLESTDGNHYTVISAYALSYVPLSYDGLLGTTSGECIVVPQTVYFGNNIIEDTGKNHDVLYNAIKWTAEHPSTKQTKVLIMPGWGGDTGWSQWQTFASSHTDINLSRWSTSSSSRNQVTTAGLEATKADVLIDNEHNSATQQGGFYSDGELQALEWYVKTKGHGYIVTSGSLGNHTLQTNQTEKLMELLGINTTGTLGTYDNSESWIIDQPYHPLIDGISTWNPGDVTGTLETEEAVKIAHLYSTQGNHQSLISAYEGFEKGSCSCQCNIPPRANFTWYPTNPTTQDSIQFTDQSTDIDGLIVNWTWDFDDGNISYQQNPTHQYQTINTYQVTLTVRDDAGEPGCRTKILTVTTGGPIINLNTTEHFSTIQAAIDDTDTLNGHRIFVGNGTYYEHIILNKQLTLIGENTQTTIIDGSDTTTVITVTADYCHIENLTITNGGTNNCLYLNQADYTTIEGTYLTSSENGILIQGSWYTTIKDNNASYNNDDGVEIAQDSQHTLIQNNTFYQNGAGVFIYHAMNNTIDHNMIRASTAFGIQLFDKANDNRITNNTILGTTGLHYPDPIDGDAICLFYYSSTPIYRTYIENNILDDNLRGITLRQTYQNIIRQNKISNSSEIGIQIFNTANNNQIYHNNLITNTIQGSDAGTNTWHHGYPSGGNYWSDYTGSDQKHGINQNISGPDAIGDTPYNITGKTPPNQDQYPLMLPWNAHRFILNLNNFPMYTAISPYNQMCGPACAQMTLNYMWWNSSNDTTPPLRFDDQQWLYTTGHANNTNTSIPYLDMQGLWKLLQTYRPLPYTTYGYNFNKYSNTNQTYMLRQICEWINYTIGTYGGYKPGYPTNVPALIPAYGDYSNWMAVRGIHTDKPTYPLPSQLTIYGFWVNDPLPTGIGVNSYKTTAEWITTYYKPMQTTDTYNGKYIALCEPPETKQETKINIAQTTKQFTTEQKQIIAMTQNHNGKITKELQDQTTRWIIDAAIKGVNEQLIPYDAEFETLFQKTRPGTPLFIQAQTGSNYYAVPFNLPIKIEKIQPSKPLTQLKTSIVILIDATDGSFKEASWTTTPITYLPITQNKAQQLIIEYCEEQGIELKDPTNMIFDLVYRHSSPYYPDWKADIGEGIYLYVTQQGVVEMI